MNIFSLSGFFTLLLVYILMLRFRKISGSVLLNPFILFIITFCISFGTVISLFLDGFIMPDVFVSLLFCFLLFFAAYYFVFCFRVVSLPVNSCLVVPKKFDIQMCDFLFFVSVVLVSIYSYLLWGNVSTGDERLVFNKYFRPLQILQSVFSFWAVILAGYLYSLTKKPIYAFYFSVLIFLSLFSGSKGLALSYFLWFAFFYLWFNRLTISNYLFFCLSSSLFLFGVVYFLYGAAFFNVIVHRLQMSGDVYVLSFVIGDYTLLNGFFDVVQYLLHPFSSLIGIRGYDMPFGAELVTTAGHEKSGMGPNSHLTMLGLVFFPDDIFKRFVLYFFGASVFIVTMLIAFKILKSYKLHLFFRLNVFANLVSASFNIFIDIGMYQFIIVYTSISILFYILMLFFLNLGKNEKSSL